MIAKACPVPLHPDGAPLRIAMFKHPVAGMQLVKGTMLESETPERAAARELFEESGLETRSALRLGASEEIVAGQIWHFSLCRVVPPVRDQWQHACTDDGGHLFKFHWHALDESAPHDLAPPFQRALAWITEAL